ncbi:Programmed cell death protein 2, C-terminal [Parasponia andersonii]|uniref:Programmed cell death protein 2, C-terminal n=1 Tax=Parasponia andersonii TaxID=3476 RepID=A0A2P5C3G0_PARAD|nr:Programmed cell death protein 2, C-terminal [Parasponia andersonii]
MFYMLFNGYKERQKTTQVFPYFHSLLQYVTGIPGAKPLWPMSSGRPSKADIPKCSYCSGPLRFEFQILPQLLYYFHVRNDVDSLDWATIAVYTCEASCDSTVAYKEEYAWVQLS